ncbi:MAG: ATP-binding protein [Acidobacteria bacterium]|nr:ATP-binding protein [Acidobacteriota bacterium]
MKLKRLRLRNFRCFQAETAIEFDDITALIGKNDSGKSTIMEALDLFLNENNPDKDDASKGGDPKDLTLICEFSELPSEVVIDEDNPTQLSAEFLLNAEGNLEIHKTYSGQSPTPKCLSTEVFANHPSAEGVKDLLQLKNPDLKKRAKELGADLTGVDTKVNAQIRAAIRKHIGNLNIIPRKIPLNDDNGKKVWEGLQNDLPAFALFKSDRPSTDQDAEAQDPLKAAVKEAIKAKEQALQAITEYVRAEVVKIANSTVEKLREMDPSLASQLNPTFAAQKWETLFKTSISGDDDIPINKRGSGVRRLILLNFFRAKAEQLARNAGRSSAIYAIEEPETSQHPNNQRMLLRALSDLSSEAQVIISTHIPMLARALPDSSLRYIHIRDDKSREIMKGGSTTNEQFARSLGVLPDNTVKLFIAVEGGTDITFLQNIATALRNDGIEIPDLEKMELDGQVIFFPMSGSNLALWSSRLSALNRPEFHLCDRDVAPPERPKYQGYVDEVNGRAGCRARSTLKKEIENYLHKDAIIAAYQARQIDLPIVANFGPFDDVPREVARLVHGACADATDWNLLSDERREEKEKNAKHTLCAQGPKSMNRRLLNEIDPDGDLLQWFRDISDLLTQ